MRRLDEEREKRGTREATEREGWQEEAERRRGDAEGKTRGDGESVRARKAAEVEGWEREVRERVRVGRLVGLERVGALPEAEREWLERWAAGDARRGRLLAEMRRDVPGPGLTAEERAAAWADFARRYLGGKEPTVEQAIDYYIDEAERGARMGTRGERAAGRRAGRTAREDGRRGMGRRGAWRRVTWAAAGCAAAVLAGVMVWTGEKGMTPTGEIVTPTPVTAVQLVTGSGQRVTLEGELTAEARAEVGEGTEVSEGRIGYEGREATRSTTGEAGRAAVEYHTIIVPRYGEYTVVLADGSTVMLNSGSRLRYPVAFGTGPREVWLEGEAFLTVARDTARAFTVHAGETAVRVLGTTFNVAAYHPREEVRTTLVSGRVEVARGEARRAIGPGEEAVTGKAEAGIAVRRVDTRVATAWTRNMFYFDEEPLERVMEALGEWYGFEVEIERASLRGRRFTVEVSRYGEIDQVLRVIEETGLVHCRKEGRKIVVN